MRLDKYLKVSRIIKRRAVSKELSEKSRVKANGKIVKPSYQVKVGDQLEIRFGRVEIVVEVLDVQSYAKKEDASMMYRLIEERKVGSDDDVPSI